jgi:predicted RNase H-like HicB family nuclease
MILPTSVRLKLAMLGVFYDILNNMQKISVIIEKDAAGYYAYSPDLPGCQSQGDSLEEAVANIKEAVSLYLDTLSPEEMKELVCKEIFSTTIEVSVAQNRQADAPGNRS